MTAHTTEQERANFEVWARDRYPSINLTRDGDDYAKALAKDYWSLWQAARRAPVVPQSEDFNAAWLSHIAGMDEKHDTSNNSNFFAAGFIAGQRSAPVVPVPQGWQLAPVKATNEMAKAGAQAARGYLERTGGNSPWAIYEAMLAAAPQPQEADHIPDAKKMAAAPGQLSELVRKLCISAKRDGELGRDSSRTKEIAQQLCQLIEPQSP